MGTSGPAARVRHDKKTSVGPHFAVRMKGRSLRCAYAREGSGPASSYEGRGSLVDLLMVVMRPAIAA